MGPINSNGEARRLLDDFRKLRQSQANLAIQLWNITARENDAAGFVDERRARYGRADYRYRG
jgi:hypothetical protein